MATSAIGTETILDPDPCMTTIATNPNQADRALQGDEESEVNPALDRNLEMPTEDQVPINT